ncbi:MAG: hypothetical protein WBW88_05040 [Rhodothermales bacterium]
MAVDVCYVLKDGFPARMVLHSEILPRLHEMDVSVALVVPNAHENLMQEMAERHHVTLFEAPNVYSRLTIEYEWLIRRYLFEDVLSNPSLRSWHLKLRDMPEHPTRNRLRAAFYLTVNRLSLRSARFRRFLQRIEKRLFLDNDEVATLIQSISPKLLISTYPVSILEAAFLHEARKAGVTTVSQLLSWDNITSKGRFSVVSDLFLTWGPIMSAELAEYYDVPASHVYECGVAHFDQHVNAVVPGKAKEILREIGLNPEDPYLFFGMSSPTVSPNEIDVVEWLAHEVRRGAFGPCVQLVIRPHPQNIQGYTADKSWLPRLQAVAGGPIAVDYPALEQSELAWNLKEDDLPRLVNLLAGSTIVLNSGSTLAIDGIIHDKPVILTLFDGNEELPWHRSIRRYREVIHMRKLIDLGGLRVAGSYDELTHQIAEYLANPDLDAAGRARTRELECGSVDGHACERIANVLADLLHGQQIVAATEPAGIHG